MGTAVDVRPQANAELKSNSVLLVNGADLFEGQKIITGPEGQVQVVFADQTHLVVGPSSSLVIETYLMRNDGTAASFAVNALGGTFRFITGNSPKSAYKISTPTGTIGIRGTEFDFNVHDDGGKTDLIIFKGEATMCPFVGECVTVSKRCEIGQIASKKDAELIKTGRERTSAVKGFKYVRAQQRLRSDFRVRFPGECVTKSAPESIKFFAKNTPPAPPPPPVEDPVVTPEPCDHEDHGHGHGHGHGTAPFGTRW